MLSRFKLRTLPFTREIAVANRFMASFIEEEALLLKKTIDNRMSGLLVAPAGTGKTTCLRTLVSLLPESRYKVRYLKVTDLSKRYMCQEICHALGAKNASTYPGLVRSIQDYFQHTYQSEGLRPVLILDEAHDLRPSVFSMFRLLTNFEMDSKLIVSIIFAGQSPLKGLLRQEGLYDIAQRIDHYGELRLLSREESLDYLNHGITVAGSTVFPFDKDASESLYEFSRGNMRALGSLARKSLEVADSKKCDVVSLNHVTAAKSKLFL
jgi:general secretion pathway protein A